MPDTPLSRGQFESVSGLYKRVLAEAIKRAAQGIEKPVEFSVDKGVNFKYHFDFQQKSFADGMTPVSSGTAPSEFAKEAAINANIEAKKNLTPRTLVRH